MWITSIETATEFANSWIATGNAKGARRAILSAAEGQRRNVAIDESRGRTEGAKSARQIAEHLEKLAAGLV